MSSPQQPLRVRGKLAHDLREAAKEIGHRRGIEEARALFDGQIEPAVSVAANTLQPGDRAPDFTLVDADGFPVTLSGLLVETRAVLVFYRGPWCPFCNLQLRALAQRMPQIGNAGARLVAISPAVPQPDDQSSRPPFPVLWDAKNAVARSYRLLFRIPEPVQQLLRKRSIDLDLISNGAGWELPVPAAFVVEQDRTISAVFAEADYRTRPDPDEILAALTAAR